MRIRSHYLPDLFTLSLARRMVGPLSTLLHRGGNVAFDLINSYQELTTRDDTITILPDWETSAPLRSTSGLLVYDLSDAERLQRDGVRAVLGQCELCLVPNSQTAALARAYARKVVVVPSMVFSDWLLGQRVYSPETPVILLAGKEPACLKLAPVLTDYLKKHQITRLITEFPSVVDALHLPSGRVILSSGYEPTEYPVVLRSSFLTLFPGEDPTVDVVPVYEAAFLGNMVLAGPGYSAARDAALICSSPVQWESMLEKVTIDEAFRRRLVHEHQEVARRLTVTRNINSLEQVLERQGRALAG